MYLQREIHYVLRLLRERRKAACKDTQNSGHNYVSEKDGAKGKQVEMQET